MAGMVYFAAWLGLASIRLAYWVVYGSFFVLAFLFIFPWIVLYEIGLEVQKNQNG